MQSIGPRFELAIKGKRIHVIGIPNTGVLGIDLNWMKRSDRKIKPEILADPKFTMEAWKAQYLSIKSHGLDSISDAHVNWNIYDVVVGATVRFTVLPPGEFGGPVESHERKTIYPGRPEGGWPLPVLPMLTPYEGSDDSGNYRFHVAVNGESKTTTGIVGSGVFMVGIHWVARRQPKIGKKRRQVEEAPLPPIIFEEIVLQAGGLDTFGNYDVHFTAHKQNLKIGDVVDIEILPPGKIDSALGRVTVPFKRKDSENL